MYLHILSWRIGAELVRRMGIDIRETGFITTDYQKVCKGELHREPAIILRVQYRHRLCRVKIFGWLHDRHRHHRRGERDCQQYVSAVRA